MGMQTSWFLARMFAFLLHFLLIFLGRHFYLFSRDDIINVATASSQVLKNKKSAATLTSKLKSSSSFSADFHLKDLATLMYIER